MSVTTFIDYPNIPQTTQTFNTGVISVHCQNTNVQKFKIEKTLYI